MYKILFNKHKRYLKKSGNAIFILPILTQSHYERKRVKDLKSIVQQCCVYVQMYVHFIIFSSFRLLLQQRQQQQHNHSYVCALERESESTREP
jgi:hypothetical protein